MTMIDYAKYLLSVCGRRFTHLYRRHYLDSTPALPSLSALLSYLKTQTASIYGYLQTRFAGDPTSGIPSITPTQPLTFANLLTNIQKLSTRKIDTGASTQIPDGMSLVRLLCDTTAASAVTELIDTNTGWTNSVYGMLNRLTSIFTNATSITLNCIDSIDSIGYDLPSFSGISLPKLEKCTVIGNNHIMRRIGITNLRLQSLKQFYYLSSGNDNSRGYFMNMESLVKAEFPELLYFDDYRCRQVFNNCQLLTEIIAPKLTRIIYGRGSNNGYYAIRNCPNLKKVVFGALHELEYPYFNFVDGTSRLKLIHLEFGQGTDVRIYIPDWNPTEALLSDSTSLVDTEAGEPYTSNLQKFLYNFRQYLFLRLADRTATTALTLTLSSAVYTALTTETSTLAELGITTLTDKEQAAGITLATAYNTWLDTYRAAINWNITNAG